MKEILLTSSVLILAIAALRAVFKNRVSHRFQYALWALVALRLLIPVQFGEFQFSISTLTQDAAPITVVEQQMNQTVMVPTYSPNNLIYQRVEREFEAEGYDVSDIQVQIQIREETEKRIDPITWSEVFSFVWIAGMIVMVLWFLAVNSQFYSVARRDARRLNIDAPVPVLVSERLSSPCLMGLFRPVILLTPAAAQDDRMRRHVLTHELTHYRHGDHIWSLVRCICLCVYWFDPLVWLAAVLSRRDCELACDEGALKSLGQEERFAYGKTLLDVVSASLNPSHLLETATAMNESKRQLTERVNLIVKQRKFYVTAAICLGLVIALVAGCTFTGGVAQNDKPEEKEEYLLLETVTQFHQDGTETTEWTRNYYDEKGHLIQIMECSEGITVSTVLSEYDEAGNLTRLTTFDQNGVVTGWTEYIYGNNGNLLTETEHIETTPLSEPFRTTKYTYDKNGNVLTRTTTIGNTTSRIEYSYDAQGRYTQVVYYGDGALHLRNEYQFSDDGLTRTMVSYDETDTEVSRTVAVSNEDETETILTITLPDGTEEQRSVTTFDDAGNLLTQQTWIRGELYLTIQNRYIRPGEEGIYTLTSTPEDTQPDETQPEDTVPEPTGCQPVPEDYSADTMVTIWKEIDLEWEDGVGNANRFTARIPVLYPFSNDAIAINQSIANKYGAILEEAHTAAAEGYSGGCLSIDYEAYLNGNILSLVIILNTGTDYIDYEIYNFYLEPGEQAVTMNPAAMADYCLGLSYPEFLYAAAQFSIDAFESYYADPDSQIVENFKTEYLDMHGMPLGHNPLDLNDHTLYLDDTATLILRFNRPSMAGADFYPTLARFNPIETDPAECYNWLFNIHADGAYATAHHGIFADAFLADPEEFLYYLNLESNETITHVARGLAFEGGFTHADAIREYLDTLPDSHFKTIVLDTLNEHH